MTTHQVEVTAHVCDRCGHTGETRQVKGQMATVTGWITGGFPDAEHGGFIGCAGIPPKFRYSGANGTNGYLSTSGTKT
jgi:hypothetical protein